MVYEYVRIYHLSKFSKYAEGLLIKVYIVTFFLHLMWFNTTILYAFHSLTAAICGLHCCLIVLSVKEMLRRLCKPINRCERCRMR